MFGKKKKDVVYFVNSSSFIVDNVPIQRSTSKMPPWFLENIKKQKNNPDEFRKVTVSKCPGIVELYKDTYTMYSPYDFLLEFSEDRQEFRHKFPPAFKNDQLANCSPFILNEEDYLPIPSGHFHSIIKLIFNWWCFSTNPDIKVRMDSVPYSLDADIIAMPGILDLNLSNQLNVQAIVKTEKDFVKCKIDQPICQLSLLNVNPEDVEVKVVHVDQPKLIELNKVDSLHYIQSRNYNLIKKKRRKQLDKFIKENLK